MSSYIHSIATAVPDNAYDQQDIREAMKRYIGDDRRTRHLLHRIYTQSGIETRHSVIPDLNGSVNGERLFFRPDKTLGAPSTGTRNRLYTEHAQRLFVETGQKILAQNPSVQPADITHVITVSCTGFYAPGPDFTLVQELGLLPATQRYNLGFMGCYAAFPALKMAESFCRIDPKAHVLVICLELCTLHLQMGQEVDQLLSASVFADGAAGCLVSNSLPDGCPKAYRMERFATTLTEKGRDDMAWTVGDSGFEMVLSTYVPDIIEANLQGALAPLFHDLDLDSRDIDHWAVHPGGRAILDKVEQSLQLKAEQLASSRHTLAHYGNMSSATILFVLKHLLELPLNKHEEQVLAMAFGPGLTIESGRFTKTAG